MVSHIGFIVSYTRDMFRAKCERIMMLMAFLITAQLCSTVYRYNQEKKLLRLCCSLGFEQAVLPSTKIRPSLG